MKGIKKTLCLLLSLVMILSMGVPAFAFDNATSEAQANTTSSETSPFSIELSTDKSSYSATGIAKITAKVTNTSGKDIKDVSAEAVFGELAPCKKKSSQTTAEAETLKDGESLEFTYSATINKNAKKLNIIEKIILFFVRLFNGGYSAKDNGFDNGREFVESSNDIKFGKHTAVNGVKVWFGESSYFSAKDVEDREIVRSSLNSLMSSDEYQNKEEKHKINDVKKLLSKLEKEGLINNISYNSDTKCFRYYFTCGGIGTVSIKSEKKYSDPNLAPVSLLNKNQTRQNESISKSVAYSTSETNSVLMYGYDKNEYELQLDNTWKPVERLFDTWTELCNSKNMNTTIIDCPTVYEFKTALLNKDFICIFEHGNYGGYIPNTYVFMVQNEEVTCQTDLAYNKDIYFERIITYTEGDGEDYYLIAPQFFEFYYKNKLTDSIVYMLSCQGFGKGVTVDYGIADTLINDCGAKAVLGFHNSVAQCYGYQIYDKIVNSLLKGFTIGEAYDSTIDELGATDYTFLKNHLFDLEDASTRKEWLNEANRKKEEEEIATFSLQGDKTARLNVPKYDEKKITKIQGCVRDSETKAPIANAKVELRDGTNFNVMHDVNGKYHASDFEDYKVLSTTTTDENGKYTFNMPSGKYVVAVYHDDYEFNGLYFSFEKNLDGYFPADILLVPNGDEDDGDDDRPVTASGNCGADGDNVKWVLYDDGELKISGQGEMKNFTSRSSSPWYKYAYSTIKKVIIKHGITSIGDYSFDNCRNLTHITLPNTITQIGKICFRDCSKLTSIEIPESVKSIGERCFFRCDSLATINIPYSITNIGYYAFDECENLEYINVDLDNQNYCSLDGVLFNKNKTELIQYTIGNERKEYVVPIGVTYIWSLAFYGCDNLLKINLPNTLVKIGDATFYGCKNLNYINIPNGVKYIGTNFLGWCHSLERIFIPSSVTYIGSFAFENNKGLLSIDVDKNNLNYSSEEGVLFSKDKSQLIRYPEGNKTTEYVIPNNVIYVNMDAFRYCSNIESVTIPKNVKAIYGAAFSECTKLKNIKMENGLESIGEFSFQHCDSLEKIDIPSSVTYIGDYAFSFCDNLKSVTINNSNCTIYNHGYTISNTATIYGYKNSTAQAYAEKYNRTFIPLD